ncbi:unnamed protein product, partial [Polarella glacialis]
MAGMFDMTGGLAQSAAFDMTGSLAQSAASMGMPGVAADAVPEAPWTATKEDVLAAALPKGGKRPAYAPVPVSPAVSMPQGVPVDYAPVPKSVAFPVQASTSAAPAAADGAFTGTGSFGKASLAKAPAFLSPAPAQQAAPSPPWEAQQAMAPSPTASLEGAAAGGLLERQVPVSFSFGKAPPAKAQAAPPPVPAKTGWFPGDPPPVPVKAQAATPAPAKAQFPGSLQTLPAQALAKPSSFSFAQQLAAGVSPMANAGLAGQLAAGMSSPKANAGFAQQHSAGAPAKASFAQQLAAGGGSPKASAGFAQQL